MTAGGPVRLLYTARKALRRGGGDLTRDTRCGLVLGQMQIKTTLIPKISHVYNMFSRIYNRPILIDLFTIRTTGPFEKRTLTKIDIFQYRILLLSF